MTLPKVALALVVLLSPQGAREVPVAIYAPGTASCGAWLGARQAHLKHTPGDVRFIQFESFVAGYASAYNIYAGGPPGPDVLARSVLGGTSVEQHWGIIDTFCSHNPKQPFHQGVVALINELNARTVK